MIRRQTRTSSWLFPLLFITTLGCGGKVVVDAASGGTGTGGSGGAAPGDPECSAPVCIRFPEGDSQCFEPGFVGYGCQGLTAVPEVCTYMSKDCTNCVDWCCPEDISSAPTRGPKDIPSPPGSPPAGCSGRPELNWMCEAQSKPSRAVSCDVEPDSQPGCVDSAYDGAYCTDDRFYCCP